MNLALVGECSWCNMIAAPSDVKDVFSGVKKLPPVVPKPETQYPAG